VRTTKIGNSGNIDIIFISIFYSGNTTLEAHQLIKKMPRFNVFPKLHVKADIGL
jgi:hypothetical protein